MLRATPILGAIPPLSLALGLLVSPSLAFDPGLPAQRLGSIIAPKVSLLGALAQLDVFLAGTANPNAIMLGHGNRISFCPALSCVLSPSVDHQRASALFSATTQDDGHSEEQTVAITTTIGTGAYKAWAPSTAYAVGDNVNFQDSRNAVYRVTQAGTSAASGSGPSDKTMGIVDSTVRWDWINDAAINAKIGLYNEVQVVPGGGNSWAQANNFQLQAGVKPLFHVNAEFDFTNNSGTDCLIGISNCNNVYLRNYGTNKITSAVNVEGPDIGKSATYFGLYFHGSRLSSDATVEIDTGGVAGIRIGTFLPAGYSQAGVVEQSTSPIGVALKGAYSGAAISTISATATSALAAAPGQRVCLNGIDGCLYFSNGELHFVNGGVDKVVTLQ